MSHCLLIDGNNIVFRAYYAFQNQRLKTSDGVTTGALYGFLRMLLKMLKDRQPDLIAVAFDTSRDTFRRRMYPEYKAKRKPTPPDLLEQLPLAHKAVAALNIKILTRDDYEADDLIGSAAKSLAKTHKVTVVTGDRDLLQLIEDNVLVELCQKGVSDTREIDTAEFNREYGFDPRGIIELKALMGDSSDNIPGVKGIGEKKGMALIQQFKTIENLYSSLAAVDNGKLRQKLLDDRAMAFLSHDLATIRCDLHVFDSPEELRWNSDSLNADEFTDFLSRYEFGSLYKEFAGHTLPARKATTADEASLSAKVATSHAETGAETVSPPEPEIKPLPGEKLLISKVDELKRWLAKLGDTVCIDIETDGFDPVSNRIVGVSLAADSERAAYIPLRHAYLGLTPDDQLEAADFFAILRETLPDRLVVGHNLKFDLAFLANEGVEAGDRLFDTLIAGYVIDPTRSNALKNLGRSLFNFEVSEYREVAGAGNFAGVDLAAACEYACQDVLLTMHLYRRFQQELAEKKLKKLFDELEMPILRVLLTMERNGIGLNSAYLRELSAEIAGRLTELEASIYQHAGRSFNINSTQQLQEILFKEIGLNPPKKTKTGFSTDSEVLKLLSNQHPICADLLEYRELAKLRSTYAESLTTLVNSKTGLIHASFNQAVTATGRLSSSNPNMQNIPIKTEWGRKIRRAFMPPRPDDVFVSIDYSQIELRLLAHFSQDPGLVEAFVNNTDIHAISAGRIFRKPPAEVTSQERNIGKTVNFGILYGISAHGLAEDLAITRPQAKEYIDSFYNSFQEVTRFFDEVVRQAQVTGEVETLLGRVRQLPDINSGKFQLRSGAERMAKNTRLQGSAADLVKKAMLDTVGMLREKNFATRLILQIHDELVFSVPKAELKQVAPLLKHCMENCVKLNVPLVCDLAYGENLADLEEVDL
ncbi:MAG: DNA polymerase I [Candidatus Riflebacteria bacterium HGW-Riflebacteria-2]|jgi:DNA polymerase-1|nr:MAG: DNA polymerase I [Candidatus Riflebacteria bacterium HGW-Riflebacteria-2]